MATVRTEYLGKLRTENTHLQSGTQMITDAPTDNQGRGEAFSPTDLTATSLGTCIITTMGIAAQREDIDLTGSELSVTKVMSTQAPRRIARIEVALRMRSTPELDEAQRKKYENIAHTCPVALSLHPDIEQVITFEWKELQRMLNAVRRAAE
ncbi:MAG: OsmC family protein [Cytophagaceae bacterium]|nr:OsmC family protein [Cytophagaceae bacterium]